MRGSYISVESTLYNINTKIEYPRSVTNCLPSSAVKNISKNRKCNIYRLQQVYKMVPHQLQGAQSFLIN
jgi:hypothetical protein